jgi:hypothetical protein
MHFMFVTTIFSVFMIIGVKVNFLESRQ